MIIERREIKGERFYNGVPKRNEFRKADKPELPKQTDMLKKLKQAIVKRFLPTVRELLDVDLDADYNDGVISVFLDVSFAGEVIFSRQKTFKV